MQVEERPFGGIVDQNGTIDDIYQEVLPKKGLVERHVTWLRQDRSPMRQFFVVALTCSEVALLVVSVIGIYLVHKGTKKCEKLKAIEKFEKEKKKITPPNISHVSIKTSKRTMNHFNEYVLHKKVIWTKRIGDEASEWKKLYFDGFPHGRKPKKISADGGYLLVTDDLNKVHYMKITDDSWKNGVYRFADTTTHARWSHNWFEMPVIHHLANLFMGKLTMPKHKAWVLSDRGQFNFHYEDRAGRKHPDKTGAFTLYVLDKSGKEITLYDIWVPKYVITKIPVPDSSEKAFSAENIAASASTIMLIGYQEVVGEDGFVKRVLQLYTQFVDLDTIGWNPGLKYSYDRHEKDPKRQVIPLKSWKKQKLPQLKKKASLTKHITVVQTGRGNNSRELRIAGTNKHGTCGFYYKNVDDAQGWKFKADKTVLVRSTLQVEMETEKQEITPGVWNWKSDDSKVVLKDFGDLTVNAVVKVKGEKVRLYRREKLFLKSLGIGEGSAVYHDLVAPTRSKLKIFKGRKKIPVKVSIEGESLTIEHRSCCKGFRFQLARCRK